MAFFIPEELRAKETEQSHDIEKNSGKVTLPVQEETQPKYVNG
jgi:hypothetical protein